MKVLDSVRVLEIGGLGPGPFCAMHLADLGADVISVVREAPNAGPTGNLLNRGKRSVFADLKTEEGRRLVLDLVKDADALLSKYHMPSAIRKIANEHHGTTLASYFYYRAKQQA